MNKLKELEQKRAEIDAEIERLKRAKTGKVLRPSDLSKGNICYYCHTASGVVKAKFNDCWDARYIIKRGCAFYDKKSAINHIKARLLAHECDIAISESWDGEEIPYNDQGQPKDYLIVKGNDLRVECSVLYRHRFAFKTREHAQAFIDKHGEEAVINMLRNY